MTASTSPLQAILASAVMMNLLRLNAALANLRSHGELQREKSFAKKRLGLAQRETAWPFTRGDRYNFVSNATACQLTDTTLYRTAACRYNCRIRLHRWGCRFGQLQLQLISNMRLDGTPICRRNTLQSIAEFANWYLLQTIATRGATWISATEFGRNWGTEAISGRGIGWLQQRWAPVAVVRGVMVIFDGDLAALNFSCNNIVRIIIIYKSF